MGVKTKDAKPVKAEKTKTVKAEKPAKAVKPAKATKVAEKPAKEDKKKSKDATAVKENGATVGFLHIFLTCSHLGAEKVEEDSPSTTTSRE